MAETIVSPGVLAIENDQSFITEGPIQAGAALIGPTVKGKVGIPVLCTTYSDYLNKFGSTFLSGSQTYSYLTSISAYQTIDLSFNDIDFPGFYHSFYKSAIGLLKIKKCLHILNVNTSSCMV
jgi:hypothetical protein